MTEKTLVIVLSETRASELTFDNFKKNVIEELQADLCICIGIKPTYDYENPFYKEAKYRFLFNEPTNFADAYDEIHKPILDVEEAKVDDTSDIKKNTSSWKSQPTINAIHGLLSSPKMSTSNIAYLGDFDTEEMIPWEKLTDDYDTLVYHSALFHKCEWQKGVYGIRNSMNLSFNHSHPDITTYQNMKKSGQNHSTTKSGGHWSEGQSPSTTKSGASFACRGHWRDLFQLDDQFMGGVIEGNKTYNGSAGILVFFRWFLLKSLKENDILTKYDRFIITRSDFLYEVPHVQMNRLDKNCIWIPDGEHYGGLTDRHVVLSRENIETYLNIFNSFIESPDLYLSYMKNHGVHNLETMIKTHLNYKNVMNKVKYVPYVMYSVRAENGSTRWSKGDWSNEHNYFIKYRTEYDKSSYFKQQYNSVNRDSNLFYTKFLTN